MNLLMNQLLDSKLTKTVVENEKTHMLEEEREETAMVLWDCAPMFGLEMKNLLRKYNCLL